MNTQAIIELASSLSRDGSCSEREPEAARTLSLCAAELTRLRTEVATLKARIADLARRKPAESPYPNASGFPDS